MKSVFLLTVLLLCGTLVFGVACDDDDDAAGDDDDTTGDDDTAPGDDDDDDNNDDNDDDDDDDNNDDDDNDDNDDTTPYWLPGEDLGPLTDDEYRPLRDQGLSAAEWPVGLAAKDALLQSASVKWVATFDPATGEYTIWHADGDLTFTRTIGADGFEFAIIDQTGPHPFPYTDPMTGAGYEAELALLQNPGGVQLPAHGYDVDDERVGWFPDDEAVYPEPLARIAQVFDSPNGPDIAFDLHAAHGGGVGTHGSLGLMQSRATLLLSGAGIEPGVRIDDYAWQVDIAPTVLALLGADPVEGVDARGHRVTSNFLLWQDGRVLTEAMTDPSVQGLAERVVVLLFDGLAPNELFCHYENADAGGLDLPNFFELIDNGAYYQGGALTGWPSFSLPGHTTVGTGAFQGHHGLLSNESYRSDLEEKFTFSWYESRLEEILHDPQIAVAFYLTFFEDERGVESMYDAVHRSFGVWDLLRPGTWNNAYTACVNELTFTGADYGYYPVLQILAALLPDDGKFSEDVFALADATVPLQIQATLSKLDPTHQPPTLTYASFYITDAKGEGHGPHSPAVREKLVELDAKVGRILDAYRDADLFDTTTFLVVSDHGMELLRPDSLEAWQPHLAAAGIKYEALQGKQLLYLKVMTLDAAFTDPLTLTVAVANENTDAPVEGAALSVTGGTCQPCTAVTDDTGAATVSFGEAPTGETIAVTVTHASFSPASVQMQAR
jgi:phosphonoacetate hydrolase